MFHTHLGHFIPSSLGYVNLKELRSRFTSRICSGDWFKTIISLRKSREGRSKIAKGSLASEKLSALKTNNDTGKESSGLPNGIKTENFVSAGVSVETIAATRIQTAFRAYKAEIRARRICMVTEDRIRRKKLDSQLKHESKLHDQEVEWCGGSETMEEILARVNQREEASVKRERAMAYAFSHQWRVNSSQSQGLGQYELSKADWGWSWKDRWIAARPWESSVPGITISSRESSKVQKDNNPSTPKGSPLYSE